MSAIGGIYAMSNRRWQEHEVLLRAISRELAQWGPDCQCTASRGAVSMVFRGFHTRPSSRFEQQPFQDHSGILLAWDGRLDNGPELKRTLGGMLNGEETEPGLLARAYLKWGPDFLSKITGDFALALWDPNLNILLLARDPFAARPLFYCLQDGLLVWATALRAIVDTLPGPFDVDLRYVAHHLTYFQSMDYTPFQNINTVKPGHFLVVEQGSCRQVAYWKPDTDRTIHYADDREYETHFFELFREAVRCRLQTDGVVFSELSGGLDSSSIVLMADDIIAAGEAPAKGLETVSYVFDHAPESDERQYIRHVTHRRGKKTHEIREEDHRIFGPLIEETSPDFPSCEHCFGTRQEEVHRLMANRSARILLRGGAGDQVVFGEVGIPYELADFWSTSQWHSLARGIREWGRVQKKTAFQLIWETVIRPFLPYSWQAARQARHLPEWISGDFAGQYNLRELMVPLSSDREAHLPSSRYQRWMMDEFVYSMDKGFYLKQDCLEVSHPFLHRPFVEFCLAIPLRQKLRPGETRSILRRSFRELLPAQIARRQTKSGPDQAIYRALIRNWPRLNALLAEPRVCDYGIAEREPLLAALARARHGLGHQIPDFLRILSLELWLRSLERRHGARFQVA